MFNWLSIDDVKKSIRKAIKKINKDNLKNYFTSSLKRSK